MYRGITDYYLFFIKNIFRSLITFKNFEVQWSKKNLGGTFRWIFEKLKVKNHIKNKKVVINQKFQKPKCVADNFRNQWSKFLK